MVARLRVVRTTQAEANATGDLFEQPEIAANTSVRSATTEVLKQVDVDSDIRRRPMDDESQLLDVDQLYPASQELNTKLSTALGLILQGLVKLERALDANRAGDAISADDQVTQLLAVLLELFCMRTLGDGFANVVSACISSIQNSGGEFLNLRQLVALNSALLALRKKPFMRFESSLEVIERLESAELNVDARGIEVAQDWLIGSGAR